MFSYGSNARPRPSAHPRPLAPASSLQSLIPRPSDFNKNMSFFASNNDIHRMSAYRDSMLPQSTPLAERFAQADASSVNNFKQGSQYSQFSQQPSHEESRTTSASIQSSDFMVRASSIGVFANLSHHSAAPLTEDPRPLANHEWQYQAMTKLLELLEATNFDWKNPKHRLQVRHLVPIDRATLIKVFHHLLGVLFGGYDPGEKKLEEEVPKWSQKLGYPYYQKLTKNTLTSPNINSAWPTVCGFLDWMREIVLMWLNLTGSKSRLAGFFKIQPDGDADDDLSTDAFFYKLRMDLMIEAYHRFCSGYSEHGSDDDLIQAFDQKLFDKFGDLKAKADGLKAELDEKQEKLNDRINNYESLEILKNRYEAVMQSRAQNTAKLQEYQRNTTQAEREIIAAGPALQAKEKELAELRAQVAQLEKQVQTQPLKKDKVLEIENEIQSQKDARNDLMKQLSQLQARIEEQMMKKSTLCHLMRESIQTVRRAVLDLCGKVPAVGVVNIPDFGDQTDMTEYMAVIKKTLEQIMASYQKHSEETRQANDEKAAEFAKLEQALGALKIEAERYQVEKEGLAKAQSSFELDEKSLPDLSKLLEKKQSLMRELSEREANLDKLNSQLKGAQRKRNTKASTFKKLQGRVALHKAASEKVLEKISEKQQSRVEHLNRYTNRMAAVGEKAKQVEGQYIRGMTEALEGTDSQK
ncbi:kinetochore protein NDC80 homolog [Paramacrobiotus metropolitanus]|uniref:kinetochore protein NDC80 homolog n=1 Tax=Paramacrobiotus metropolitanus TaxID=2943436 RepID=UPI0024461366|nr:kinetochore protein NDC80 homolog [Paramacrobiotus metropolitanus]XP_055346774.1 kinetochore protein NDC80 homolog [Paramacrobiotus metropolitanus]